MTGAYGPTVDYDAIAAALGISSQELRNAQVAGKSVAELAQEDNLDLLPLSSACLQSGCSALQ